MVALSTPPAWLARARGGDGVARAVAVATVGARHVMLAALTAIVRLALTLALHQPTAHAVAVTHPRAHAVRAVRTSPAVFADAAERRAIALTMLATRLGARQLGAGAAGPSREAEARPITITLAVVRAVVLALALLAALAAPARMALARPGARLRRLHAIPVA